MFEAEILYKEPVLSEEEGEEDEDPLFPGEGGLEKDPFGEDDSDGESSWDDSEGSM